uniref:Uncharacterized protein n=1 Tax=Ditylenchus dipsaci TaxID=166011 RepID=A0A915EPU4_9BILA
MKYQRNLEEAQKAELAAWLSTRPTWVLWLRGYGIVEQIRQMKNRFRRQHVLAEAGPMMNLLHSSDADDAPFEVDNWTDYFTFLNLEPDDEELKSQV